MRRFLTHKKTDALAIHHFEGIQTFWWRNALVDCVGGVAFQDKQEAGLNRFVMSAKQWIEKTHAKGIIAKAGRYGVTYAYKDIAFEFASWVSPQFKL